MDPKPMSWRTSEFWAVVLAAAGSIVCGFGWIPKDQWDNVVYPALTYAALRLIGKGAKSV